MIKKLLTIVFVFLLTINSSITLNILKADEIETNEDNTSVIFDNDEKSIEEIETIEDENSYEEEINNNVVNSNEEYRNNELSFVYINPLYRDLYQNITVDSGSKKKLLTAVNEEEYVNDEEELAEEARSGFVNHDSNIVLYYEFSNPIDPKTEFSDWFNNWFHNVCLRHTGNPNEGDYLVWNYGFIKYGISYLTYQDETKASKFKITISPYYHSTKESAINATTKVNEIVDGFNFNDSTSNYKKIKTIYDFITNNVDYDYDNLDLDNQYAEQYNNKEITQDEYINRPSRKIYSGDTAINEYSAVCQGYAQMLYRMLLMCGIDNRIVTSQTHAWNIANIDDVYYYIDSTWGVNSYNKWLLIGNQEMVENDQNNNHVLNIEYTTKPFIDLYTISNTKYQLQLDKPTNIKIKNNVISWDKVDNADSYDLTISCKDYPIYPYSSITTNSVDVSTYVEGISQRKIFNVSIVAKSNNGYKDSDYATFSFSNYPELSKVEATLDYSIYSTGKQLDELNASITTPVYGENKLTFKDVKWQYSSDNSIYEDVSSNIIQKGYYRIYAGVDLYATDTSGIKLTENTELYVNNSKWELLSGSGFDTGHNSFQAYVSPYMIVGEDGAIGYEYVDKTIKVFGEGRMPEIPSNYPLKKYKDEAISALISEDITSIHSLFSDFSKLENVELGQNLIEIGYNTFYNCGSLENIVLPRSLKTIGTYAFNSSGIESITFTSNLESIGDNAFSDCPNLGTVSFTKATSLKSIGNNAFVRSSKIKSIYIQNSDNLTTIGDSAFAAISSLENVSIYSPLEYLGEYCFAQCPKLSNVSFNYSNTNLKEIKNYTFNECSSLTSIYIPSAVEKISLRAFQGCSSLGFIYIPPNVKTINSYAFSGCTNLKYASMPIKLKNVTKNIFDSESIVVYCPDSSTAKSTFTVTSSLNTFKTTLSNTNMQIGESLSLSGKTSLNGGGSYNSTIKGYDIIDWTSSNSNVVKIQDKVAYAVGKGTATIKCKSTYLDEEDSFTITVTNDSSEYKCGDSATCTLGSGELRISGSGDTYDYHYASDSPLYSLSYGVEKIVVENGITSIGNYLLPNNMINVTSISLPSTLTKIGRNAFNDTKLLKTITIPSKVKKIDSILNNSGLESIVFEDGIEDIVNSLNRCSNLNDVQTSNTLLSLVDSFDICPKLLKLELPDTVTYISGNAYSLRNMEDKVVLPKSINRLGTDVFYDCVSLKEFILPYTITTILGDDEDNYPDILYGDFNIEYIALPASLTNIHEHAFFYDDIIKSLKGINNEPSKLKTIFVYKNSNIDKLFSDKTYIKYLNPVTIDQTSINLKYGETYQLTASVKNDYVDINGYDKLTWKSSNPKIVSIDENGLIEAHQIGSATITVTSSFGNTSDTITINSGYDVEYDSYNKILHIYGEGELPDFTSSMHIIDDYANIKEVVIHEGITKIGVNNFRNCSRIEKVTLPSTILTISDSAFFNCGSLKEINLPNGLTRIGKEAFANDTKLKSVYIPKSVTQIDATVYTDSPFYGEGPSFTIYTDATSKPIGWSDNWNSHSQYERFLVVYGCSKEDCLKTLNYWDNVDIYEKNVVIPNYVKAIPAKAFAKFSNLRNIYIPSTVTAIYGESNDYPFKEIFSVWIYTNASSKQDNWGTCWNYIANNKKAPVEYNYDIEKFVFNCLLDKNATTIIIPEYVSYIPENALSLYSNLTKLYIPNTVSDIAVSNYSKSPIYNCLDDIVIFTDASSKLEGWNNDFNVYKENCHAHVVYNSSIDECNSFVRQAVENIDVESNIDIPKYNNSINKVFNTTKDGQYILTSNDKYILSNVTWEKYNGTKYVDVVDDKFQGGKYRIKYQITLNDYLTRINEDTIINDSSNSWNNIKDIYSCSEYTNALFVSDEYEFNEYDINTSLDAFDWIESKDKAFNTEIVTITSKYDFIDDKYIEVYKGDEKLTLTKVDTNKYTFEMPNQDVNVKLSISFDIVNQLEVNDSKIVTPKDEDLVNENKSIFEVKDIDNLYKFTISNYRWCKNDINTLAGDRFEEGIYYFVGDVSIKDDDVIFGDGLQIVTPNIDFVFNNNKSITIYKKFKVLSKEFGEILSCDIKDGWTKDDIPKGFWTSDIEPIEYTGKAITTDFRLYDYNHLLIENIDYTVKYSNNTKSGIATITISGKGNYAQTLTKTFEIKPLSINPEITLTDSYVYNAKGQKLSSIKVLYDGKTLKENTDYTYAIYKDGIKTDKLIEPGKYTIKFNGKGNYDFTKEMEVRVGEPTQTLISKLSISISPNKFVYDGDEKEPTVVIKQGKDILDNSLFNIEYPDNISSGTKEVIIKAKDGTDFIGSIKKTYSITGTAISKATITGLSTSIDYSGIPYEPDLVLTIKGNENPLEENRDYVIDWSDNVEVGKATLVITGINGYTGSIKKTVQIKGVSMSKVLFNQKTLTNEAYTGNPITKDDILLSYNDEYLNRNDYQVSYSNNINVGTATITFTGKGKYTGSVKKTFKITAIPLPEVEDIDDQVYLKGGCKPNVDFVDKELELSKDYTLSYKNNTKVGTASAVIKGKGNYKGSITKEFEIEQSDISTISNIVTTDKVYANKANIYKSIPTIIDNDGKKLASGKDFDKAIIYTYRNDTEVIDTTSKPYTNVTRNAGDLVNDKDIIPANTIIDVKVYGMGNYCGETNSSFRIVNYDISKASVTIASQYYTGKPIVLSKADLIVKIGKSELSQEDYEIVSYSNNVNKGSASLTINGLGDYGGTKTVKFNIVSKSLGITIRFNPNGGTGTMKDLVIIKDTKLTKNAYKYSGKTFMGWATDKDELIIDYDNNELYSYNYLDSGKIINLYAVWEDIR